MLSKLNLSIHFLQMHDLPNNVCGTSLSNSGLTSLFVHQQGVSAFTAQKLLCWHKGHRFVSRLVIMGSFDVIFINKESSIT